MPAEEVNFLDMPDDEFENSDTDNDEGATETEDDITEPDEAPKGTEAGDDEDDTELEDEVIEDTVDPIEDDEVDAPDDDDDADVEPDPEEDDPESQTAPEDKADDEEPQDTKTPADTSDYKAMYEELMAPFKANGAEISIKSIKDQRALMQKGANYDMKMNGIKPIRAIQKSLTDAKVIGSDGTVDEARMNFLLDINKGDKGAIQKLLKDFDIDPLDLDTEEAEKFVPTNHMPHAQELAFDEVVDELSVNESFGGMIDTLTNEWDEKSRNHFFNNPADLRKLQTDVDSGAFDNITRIIKEERVFGRLTDVSNFDAYVSVATALAKQEAEADQTAPTTVVQTKAAKKRPDNRSKRRAAGGVKTSKAAKKTEFNPLAMSDEDFAKMENDPEY